MGRELNDRQREATSTLRQKVLLELARLRALWKWRAEGAFGLTLGDQFIALNE
jgi:hypothetical protein